MNQTEFAKRRKRLMQMMGKDSVAILPAAPTLIRNRDVEYRYRPDSDFYYLTGFAESEAGMEAGRLQSFQRVRSREDRTLSLHGVV